MAQQDRFYILPIPDNVKCQKSPTLSNLSFFNEFLNKVGQVGLGWTVLVLLVIEPAFSSKNQRPFLK